VVHKEATELQMENYMTKNPTIHHPLETQCDQVVNEL
jgi:hypothetical protein